MERGGRWHGWGKRMDGGGRMSVLARQSSLNQSSTAMYVIVTDKLGTCSVFLHHKHKIRYMTYSNIYEHIGVILR